MSSNVANASRRQALRLRACLAAALGLPSTGCPSSGDEKEARPVDAPHDEDVAAETASDGPSAEDRTTKSGASRIMSIVNGAKTGGDPIAGEGEAGEAVPGPSRPGWKNAEGLYCQAEIDSRAVADVAAGCGSETEELFDVPDQPSGMHGFALDEEGTTRERAKIDDACCYHVIRPHRGRPLRSADDARSPAVAPIVERSDWAAQIFASDDLALAGRLDHEARRSAATAWANDAALEHASVAEFSRIALALLAHGAPSALVAAAQRAALDEVEHAGIAFAIASALGGRVVGPGPLDLSAIHVAPSLTSLVRETIADGCVGEGLASLELAVAADEARSPAMASAIRTMAADERRHAELGYDIVLWAIEIAGEDERAEIADALVETIAALQHALDTPDDELSDSEAPAGLGRLTAADERRVHRDGLALAIIPALEALHRVATRRTAPSCKVCQPRIGPSFPDEWRRDLTAVCGPPRCTGREGRSATRGLRGLRPRAPR